MITATQFEFNQTGDQEIEGLGGIPAVRREFRCTVTGKGLPDELVFTGEARTLPERHPNGNWAVLSLLIPAMAVGEDLHIDAPVSPLLLYNLNNDIQHLLTIYNTNLSRIRITAAPQDTPTPGTRVATGFSAGVDSFTTLAMFEGADMPPALRLDSLTTFDVGAMGDTSESEPLYRDYCARVRTYAIENGLEWFTLATNIADFYSGPDCSFQKTHILRNTAAASFFGDVFQTYLYSSTFPYPQVNKGHYDIADIEPILLPLLASENMRVLSAGAGLTRMDKTRIVAGYGPAISHLDVCATGARVRMTLPYKNCSKCWKCSRTMVSLDLCDALDAFSAVFDVDRYHRDRATYFNTVRDSAMNNKPADLDVYNQMLEKGLVAPETWLKQRLRRVWRNGLSPTTRQKLGALRRKMRRQPG
ncbi:hypothetical protein [uncultured Roseobacter sp.]|uniref:hypothetical protein n=1 Tax=uncultured Roseobacter sp. TaxID=114847 RepID=UPI002618DDF5|nr:hypothetical protein [uncultured Roseobacter sp.]